MTDLIPRDAALSLPPYDSDGEPSGTFDHKIFVKLDAIRAIPTIDPAAIREAALREAALIAQNYHMNALEWAKKIRGLEKHIGETDSLRIANDILALIGKANSMIGEKK